MDTIACHLEVVEMLKKAQKPLIICSVGTPLLVLQVRLTHPRNQSKSPGKGSEAPSFLHHTLTWVEDIDSDIGQDERVVMSIGTDRWLGRKQLSHLAAEGEE